VNARTASFAPLYLAGSMLAVGASVGVDPALPRFEPRPITPPQHASYQAPDGAIAIVGYNDMREMVGALCERFGALHPGFEFSLDLRGTRTGPPALASGISALAPWGAEFSARELADYRATTGGDPLVVRIAHASLDPKALSGPLAIIVHPSNPLTAISMTDLAGRFGGRGAAGDLRPVGLGPETALGIFFRDRALAGREFSPDFVGLPQSAAVVKLVGGDPRAIGFAAAVRATADVKILALVPWAGGAPVALTETNLVAGLYPLGRHLFLCARLPLEPWVGGFLRFVLSAEGQAIIGAGSLGYRALGADEAAAGRARLAAVPLTEIKPRFSEP